MPFAVFVGELGSMHRRIKATIAEQVIVLVAVSGICPILQADEPISREREARFRGPVALVLLDDVLTRFRHRLDEEPPAGELANLVAFLLLQRTFGERFSI